ncbi:legumain-like [Pimephales promelas]|uniref:legumain-like n=1 Tax=Pimephales promelas TaxID=90988 RepID=UPI00195555FC|nr:legumain-like [Pimephales promelas]KAG1945117.1 legumain [Pimephales promelas]
MAGKKWILLVSGSKGWEHYKHQANVCLHYQLIKKHGIPDEQIVVMMYDDIAHNPNNPASGEIISVVDSKNVYSGVPKDYTGADVTPENFLSALQGEKRTDQKKVIASGPDDKIYIYMTGVGQEGGFQFPEKALDPKAFTDALKSMHDGKKFSKMVIYMDSDYSGSMFEGLPEDIEVFALTSCHKFIENTPTDYDDQREVYLSDLFSSHWLKHLNTVDFTKDTFHNLVKNKQSKYLKRNPDGPHPCQFGDKKIMSCHLSEFLQK